MSIWFCLFLIVLCISIYLTFKILIMKNEIKNIGQTLEKIINTDTNNLITVGTNTKELTQLASLLNNSLKDLRKLELEYKNGSGELKASITDVSHDLRTPLLAAIQTLKFFLDGSLGEIEQKQRVLLSTMLQSNEDLLGLVNALLEVYRFESGKLSLCKTIFNIKDLVTQCYKELEPLSVKKEIKFNMHSDVEDELLIDADRAEIKRVITNLCGNALNYTNKGGIIDVFLKSQSGDLIFSVVDNGNGIPKEDIPHLFMRFSQGTSKKRSTGTGLGLYLSRQIVEAHGGKIWVESKVNKGSEFSFILTNVTAKSRVG